MCSTMNKKRKNESLDSSQKRLKADYVEADKWSGNRLKNFKIACEQVSRKNYFDNHKRFLLVYLPLCATSNCKHKNKVNIHQISPYVEDLFNTEKRNNTWYEALEVCRMCISPTQYLSADILKDIVEIMMNVHEDKSVDTMECIVNSCQQILMQHFSTHPPCQDDNLRNCYINFLTSPMDEKKGNKFTNRHQYEYDKGIVKYCINRLEKELSTGSKDEPLVDKNNTELLPSQLQDTVSALSWQKCNLEIFESLSRQERIERLFTVLETIIELFQFDITIGNQGSTAKIGRSMRMNKLMERALCENEEMIRQLLKIFTKLIYLNYPDQKVKIIAIWINTVFQALYTREPYCYMDYPTISKHCRIFGQNFYKIISENMSPESVIKILERTEPALMRHFIGVEYLNTLLSTDISNVAGILISFLEESKWKLYPVAKTDIEISTKLFIQPVKADDKINFLLNCLRVTDKENTIEPAPIRETNKTKRINSLNHIIHTFYLALDAFIDAYNIRSIHQNWNALNEGQKHNESFEMEPTGYSVSENFLNNYKHMFDALYYLKDLFRDLKNQGILPEVCYILENIISSLD